jgi:hypothetical protein
MKRFLFLCVFMIGSAVASFGQNTFYFAHVVNGNAGGVWKTTIFLTNPAATNTSTASGSITLTQDSSTLGAAGTPMNITFIDANGQPVAGPVIPFQIAGGQTLKLQSTGTGAFSGGFATVNSNVPVNGTAIFSLYDTSGTNLVAEAGVPAAAAAARQSIFVDIGGGFNVGVAFSNVGATAASNVTLSLLNTTAAPVMTTTIPSLGAGNHNAAFVTQFFQGQQLPQQLTGTMQITTSNGALAAIALRFAPTGVFTTLPPVTLASILTNSTNALAFILQTLHVHFI